MIGRLVRSLLRVGDDAASRSLDDVPQVSDETVSRRQFMHRGAEPAAEQAARTERVVNARHLRRLPSKYSTAASVGTTEAANHAWDDEVLAPSEVAWRGAQRRVDRVEAAPEAARKTVDFIDEPDWETPRSLWD